MPIFLILAVLTLTGFPRSGERQRSIADLAAEYLQLDMDRYDLLRACATLAEKAVFVDHEAHRPWLRARSE